MVQAEYQKALRCGLKEKRDAQEHGLPGELAVLPADAQKTSCGRESLGIVDIPLELIQGTCTALRAETFSPDFSPIMPVESEFAVKWMNLCSSHLENGIRDPIKAVEYLNRYYVIEGHKRVSVLKHFEAVSVPGTVTRLLPPRSDDPEVVAYYEFLQFYRATGLLCVVYRQPGLYARLMRAIGLKEFEEWSSEESYKFRSLYYMFYEAFLHQYPRKDKLSEAFLIYIEIFGYKASIHKLPAEIEKDLTKIKQEILSCLENTQRTLVLDDNVKPPRISLIRPPKLKVAFVHDDNPTQSHWTYCHEYGRYRLANTMRDQIETISYVDAATEEQALAVMEDAIHTAGASIIFTTSITSLLPSVKEAVLHPDVKIFNCSLNTNYPSVRTYYPRLYGAKFIKGVVAGSITYDGRIGYVADHPTYDCIANLNAFVQGVRLVNPHAQVYLEWSQLQNVDGVQRLYDLGIRLIDYRDQLGEYAGTTQNKVRNMALIQCNWGRLYQKLIRRVLDGTWKAEESQNSAINYWWGMAQGVVNVLCSHRLPSGTRRLVSVLLDDLRNGRLDPFYGTIHDQSGKAVHSDDMPMTAQDIITMDWLSSHVIGEVPKLEAFTPKAQELIRLQVLERRDTP